MEVRRLTVDDADALMALRRVALEEEPLAFSASEEDDVALDPDRVRIFLADEEGNATFGAFDPDLVGLVGLVRSTKAKERHRATLWGTFVLDAHRGRGLGLALVRAAIDAARGWPGVTQVDLGVETTRAAAVRLYEELGFRIWGTEPGALAHAGRLHDEHRMRLLVSDEE
jgi:RimJ/RimL family protein N-acetyltransferase